LQGRGGGGEKATLYKVQRHSLLASGRKLHKATVLNQAGICFFFKPLVFLWQELCVSQQGEFGTKNTTTNVFDKSMPKENYRYKKKEENTGALFIAFFKPRP
jgi:hypothetical protein